MEEPTFGDYPSRLGWQRSGFSPRYRWFISLYGAEAGNLALKFFALGGFISEAELRRVLKNILDRGLLFSAFSKKDVSNASRRDSDQE